jgi:hypothetical protein
MRKTLGAIVALYLLASPANAGGVFVAAGEDPFADGWQYVLPKTTIAYSTGRIGGLVPAESFSIRNAVVSRVRQLVAALAVHPKFDGTLQAQKQ